MKTHNSTDNLERATAAAITEAFRFIKEKLFSFMKKIFSWMNRSFLHEKSVLDEMVCSGFASSKKRSLETRPTRLRVWLTAARCARRGACAELSVTFERRRSLRHPATFGLQ